MPKISIDVDDQISSAELQQLLNAISLFRGVTGVNIENFENMDSGERQHAPKDISPSEETMDLLGPDTQRYFIDEVIKWSVRNDQLHLEKVQSWSAEEIISQAVRIFETMSEKEKSEIAQKVSQHAERQTVRPGRR